MKGHVRTGVALVAVVTLITGCVSVPRTVGPSRPAFAGTGKNPQQFSQDDDACRAHAAARVGTTPADAAAGSQVGSAILGGLLLGALGAATGALGGNAGLGAAVGAAAGLAGGTAVGAEAGAQAAADVQRQIDREYFSCMYALGHQVPGAAQAPQYRQSAPPPPPPGPAIGPAPGPSAPPAAAPCKPTGKYVRTPQGFMAECE